MRVGKPVEGDQLETGLSRVLLETSLHVKFAPAVSVLWFVLSGCGMSSKGGGFAPDDDAAADAMGTDDAAPTPVTDDDSGAIDLAPDDGGGAPLVVDGSVTLPTNFVPTDKGGYALGRSIAGGAGADAGVPENKGSANCSLVVGVVRDFKNKNDDGGTGHPDFGTSILPIVLTGLVESALGADLKPVYVGGAALTTKANFDQWYRYAAGVNEPYLVYLQFVPNSGVFTFDSEEYFPLDDTGWGNNATGDEGKTHNYGFTTEVHLAFSYKGGETFTFLGDDDVWVFIDHKLAVDLGGTHPSASGTVKLDSLSLTKGKQYSLDLFQAERQPTGSHFRADTNLAFTNCGTIPPDTIK